MLFFEQSVMEVHSIGVTMTVIEDVGLFAAFDQQLLTKAWRLFIKLILATDLTDHVSYIKPAQKAVNAEVFDMTDEAMRMLGLQLVLKGACLSNVCRPFEIASKWCDLLFMEVFAQGDIEKQSGIGLTSPGNDREAATRPETEIRFANLTCLPLYTVIAKLWPPLEVMLDALTANLDKWKKLTQE
jgi:3',5'-cyclic-nucleotide phosphodiesterase